MSGAWARDKGLNFERRIAIELRKIFPNAKRHLEFQTSEAQGYDLDNTGLYRLQCKKCKSYVSINTINEIKCDREMGEVPVLVTAGDNLEPMAVIPFSVFKYLVAIEQGVKNGKAQIQNRNLGASDIKPPPAKNPRRCCPDEGGT